MRALSSALRKKLEVAVLAARRAAESASRAALDGLGVFADRRPEHLNDEQAELRIGLRAKWRQLGGERELLVSECAYEQWHRLLFARFLAENHLLLHPEYRAPVTLAECDDLAGELGEPDGWSVAARFAAEILPGIFRLDDPCVRLRLAPEGRYALEQILEGLPVETFTADDALGWVYQFWQKDKKDEVNASERKIGGADLAPVTQLFTENYMVRFLLENSLGAWWASRHPDSPLVKGFDYLRLDEAGRPASGSFEGWPDRVSEVTVMDPCCGSGHFLVEALSMLWQMRVEEDGSSPVDAQDAVLRDNLFGLELDLRCVQIATFAIALRAWKAGGGWRPLPVPNIACSGIPVKAPVEEWKHLAEGDERLESALVRLHTLFRDADTLGSLIDPKRATELSDPSGVRPSFYDVDWAAVSPLITNALAGETTDPATNVLGSAAAALARSADFLSRKFTLITTNVPYLKRARESVFLRDFTAQRFEASSADLGVVFLDRFLAWSTTAAAVTPTAWMTATSFSKFRRRVLTQHAVHALAPLGAGAFGAISGEVVNVVLSVVGDSQPRDEFPMIPVTASSGPDAKAADLQRAPIVEVNQRSQLDNPDGRILLSASGYDGLLSDHARAFQGLATADYARFGRNFWEVPELNEGWERQQSTVRESITYGGREHIVFWENGKGALAESPAARVQGLEAWGKRGVAISQMGMLPTTLYGGDIFDNNTAALVPTDEAALPAIWAFLRSPEYGLAVRAIDDGIKVTNATLVKVPFDINYWSAVAKQAGPLPDPSSNDPTQWLFDGRPDVSTSPLQVAVARLVGYRWPEQPETDELDELADADAIVCLPSVAGEPPAADQLQHLLATGFGETWSPAQPNELLQQAGSKKKDLADWLRDEFFKQHCALFQNRPFVWHIWDGQRDGFSALVNYHRLDRKGLEKLTYTYLGQDWIERQRAEMREEVSGAETRLSAALSLQQKLEAILTGEKPFDIYVRWKELHEQPIGWEPDLNDGVRLNMRPFVEAGVLRAPVNIRWKKDRGKNPDGSERHNDLHFSVAEKRDAHKAVCRS